MQNGAGALEIMGGVDAERNIIDENDVDAHQRLDGAQLLEPLSRL